MLQDAKIKLLTLDLAQTMLHLQELWGEAQMLGQLLVLEEQEFEPLESEVIVTFHLVTPCVDHVGVLCVQTVAELAGDLCLIFSVALAARPVTDLTAITDTLSISDLLEGDAGEASSWLISDRPPLGAMAIADIMLDCVQSGPRGRDVTHVVPKSTATMRLKRLAFLVRCMLARL